MEELISRTFLGENQFWQVLQKHMTTQNRIGYMVFVLQSQSHTRPFLVEIWVLFFTTCGRLKPSSGADLTSRSSLNFLYVQSALVVYRLWIETQRYLWNFLHRLPVNPFQLISRRPASNLWTIQPFCFCHLPFPPNYTKLHASCAVLTKLSPFHFPCHERHSPWRQVSKGFPTVELWKQIFEI